MPVLGSVSKSKAGHRERASVTSIIMKDVRCLQSCSWWGEVCPRRTRTHIPSSFSRGISPSSLSRSLQRQTLYKHETLKTFISPQKRHDTSNIEVSAFELAIY